MNIDQDFSEKVQKYLHGLTTSIKPVLKTLIEYSYPKEVASLEFEIFADGFTQGFPVRTFLRMQVTLSTLFMSMVKPNTFRMLIQNC